MRQMTAATALLWIIVPAIAVAQDAKTVVENTLRAMGAANMSSIVYSGEARMATSARAGRSRSDWPRQRSETTRAPSISRSLRCVRPGLRCQPAATWWSSAVPRTRPFDQLAPAGESWAEQMEIWVTPWGFLKGAAANAATVRSRKIDGVTYQVVTWSPAQKAPSGQPYRVIGYINPQQIVERVETWVEHPVLGDMHVETFYSDYADFGGAQGPDAHLAAPRRDGNVRGRQFARRAPTRPTSRG